MLVFVVQRKSTKVTEPPSWINDYDQFLQTANIAQVADYTIPPQFNCFLASLQQATDP